MKQIRNENNDDIDTSTNLTCERYVHYDEALLKSEPVPFSNKTGLIEVNLVD